MKNIILCDLDGTLADINHRRHFVTKPEKCNECNSYGSIGVKASYPGKSIVCPECLGVSKFKPDWPAFNKACVDDAPFHETIEAVHGLRFNMGAKLWIVSGRSDAVKEETIAWLASYEIRYDRLIMRKASDYTPDDVLKRQWLSDGTIPKDDVFCVFDDRPKVLRMWQSEGIFTFAIGDLKEF